MSSRSMKPGLLLAICVLASIPLVTTNAQEAEEPTLEFLQGFDSFGLGGSDSGAGKLVLTGEYRLSADGAEGQLTIEAVVGEGWHIYSLTQPPGGPQKSELKVPESDGFELAGPFLPDHPPEVKRYEIWGDIPSEEHTGSVRWTAPIRVNSALNAEQLNIQVEYEGQLCKDDGVCIPKQQVVKVIFAGRYKTAVPTGEVRPDGAHLTLRGGIEPSAVRAGESFQLTLTAEPDDGWHVYAYEPVDPKNLSKPTLITLQLPPGWQSEPVVPSAKPHVEETGLAQQPLSHYHEKPVTWTVNLRIPQDAALGKYTISGAIGYQTCTHSQCDIPGATRFSVGVEIASARGSQSATMAFSKGSYADVADRADQLAGLSAGGGSPEFDLDQLKAQNPTQDRPVAVVLLTAFLAGFILNFMPCVLPVIGLKLMAFIQQSGDSRTRIFFLNLWYCAGLMAVFMVLATFAVFMGLSWGQQFSSTTFNVVLIGVVFAFSLSFLGVWEVPLPGFVGASQVNDLAMQEGPSGAFFKGVLTTVLATPCSAPMLTPALTWAVNQTPIVAYAGFACVGLGMASPYLVIGIFPRLISFLPKPGAWMETFKHQMGFVLLGTVVFLLTFIPPSIVVPTVAFMMGLWAALWWIGRVPFTADLSVKLRAWLGGAAFAAAVGLFAFTQLWQIMERRFDTSVDRVLAARNAAPAIEPTEDEKQNELPWQRFSLASLQELVADNQTVLVDFTADWCQTCKLNEWRALNRAETLQMVRDNGVVTLKADKTLPNPDAEQLLRKLGNSVGAIPFYAIFPAGKPQEPILLDGLYTSPKPFIEALEKAGPSKGADDESQKVAISGSMSPPAKQ